MTIKHLEEYRDPEISASLVDKIKKTSQKNIRLMEVCGTHTMSIFRITRVLDNDSYMSVELGRLSI